MPNCVETTLPTRVRQEASAANRNVLLRQSKLARMDRPTLPRRLHMAYFDMTIGRIPVGTRAEKLDEGGIGCGVELHAPIPASELAALVEHDQPPYFLELRDDGIHGEGVHIWLRSDGPDGEDREHAHFYVDDSQLPTLHAALGAILALRQSQRDGGDE